MGASRAPLRTGRLAVLGPGDGFSLDADARQDATEPHLEVLLLGGRPIGEPAVQYGPFVMNSRDDVVQAMTDYEAGRFGQVPAGALRPFHMT